MPGRYALKKPTAVILILLLLATVFTAVNLLSQLLQLSHAQTTTTTTNLTTIYIPAIQPFVINQTILNIRLLNESFVQYVYLCQYVFNYSTDCTPMNVSTINNDTGAVIDTWNVSVSSGINSSLGIELLSNLMLVRGVRLVNVSNISVVKIVVDTPLGTAISYVSPPSVPKMVFTSGNQVIDLGFIVAFSLFISLFLRGRLREVGLGMVVAGVLSLYIPFIGIFIPLYISALLIILGLIFIFMSRS